MKRWLLLFMFAPLTSFADTTNPLEPQSGIETIERQGHPPATPELGAAGTLTQQGTPATGDEQAREMLGHRVTSEPVAEGRNPSQASTSFWDVLKVLLPIVSAFLAFWLAAWWNFRRNRHIQEIGFRRQKENVTRALREEMKQQCHVAEVFLADGTAFEISRLDDLDLAVRSWRSFLRKYQPSERGMIQSSIESIGSLPDELVEAVVEIAHRSELIRREIDFCIEHGFELAGQTGGFTAAVEDLRDLFRANLQTYRSCIAQIDRSSPKRVSPISA